MKSVALILLATLLGCTGCFSRSAIPPRSYYALSTEGTPQRVKVPTQRYDVRLAADLRAYPRSVMCFLPNNQWREEKRIVFYAPLGDMIERMLLQDLVDYGEGPAETLYITAFDIDERDPSATPQARVALEYQGHCFTATIPVAGDTLDAKVAALNTALNATLRAVLQSLSR